MTGVFPMKEFNCVWKQSGSAKGAEGEMGDSEWLSLRPNDDWHISYEGIRLSMETVRECQRCRR